LRDWQEAGIWQLIPSGGGGSGATCKAVITPTSGDAAYQPSFGATPGWDMATGLGSVNAFNLVNDTAWK
jgi:hypothetical protein